MGDLVPLTSRPAPTPSPGSPGPLWRDVAGDQLRRERLAQERTLSDVAAVAGVSVQYLSEVERGRKEPSSEVIEAIVGGCGSSTSPEG